MPSFQLLLRYLSVALCFVCTINIFAIFRHEAFATLSITNHDGGYDMTIRWGVNDEASKARSSIDGKNKVEGIVPTNMATPTRSDWNLRSAHRPINPKREEQDTENKTDMNDTTKGKTTERIKSPDVLASPTNGERKYNGEKDKGKSKEIVATEDKNKKKEKGKDYTGDKNKDQNKKIGKTDDKNLKDKDKNEKEDSTVSIIGSGNSTAFSRHEHVAIVTKIHGEHQWGLLEQSMCLLYYAYNHKVLYDIVVFSTDPVEEEKIKSLQAMLSPVKFKLVVDNRGLQNEIAALSPARKDHFLKMCNVTDTSNITWWTKCNGNRLAYNWQAEFRSIHLWHHPSMAGYKTMLWLDTDGFATKVWEKDPVDYFIKNRGVIMFDNFPQAKSKYWIQKRVFAAFNATICRLKLSEETGNLVTELGTEDRCQERGIPNIHGFFHITDLNFYRSKIVTDGLATIHGDCFLCRFPDDQLAVTAPAAILAPERSWGMRGKGFRLDVFHNYYIDGIDRAKPAGFLSYWEQIGQHTFPTAAAVCKVTEAG